MAGTYGGPGKNFFNLPSKSVNKNNNYYNIVNAETGVSQLYLQSGGGDRSIGTYNPETKKFTFSNTATSADKSALSDPKVLEAVKTAAVQTAKRGIVEDGKKTPEQAQKQAQELIKPNAATNPATPTNGATTTTTTVKDANEFKVASEYAAPGNFENLVYPTSSRSSISFDYIKFTPLVYGTRAIKDNAVSFSKTRSLVNAGGSVSLAIQSGITDSNGVGWNEQSANPIQLGAAGISAQLQNGQTDVVERVISALQENSANKQVSSSVRSMLQLYFAGQAVNANIATKITGAIINPNLELLFNGPQLRPFTFNFKLSPRNQDESKEVKKILRFFKQNMAVRRGVKDLFLKSPNVFKIEYLYKKNTPHGGLNLFKSCALQNFSVDYTPEGSYATFYEDSGNGSMVSYNISLTFMELEPIYSDDYPADKSIIGY